MKSFSDRVIEIVLSIPKGKVTTYGRIARAAGGGAMSSQSVTGILTKAHKEKGLDFPYHRIVYADGSIWVDEQHRVKRMKLYKAEGIEINNKDKVVNFQEKLCEFT